MLEQYCLLALRSAGGQSGIHRLYAKNRVSFDTPKSTAPSPHYYYPMLKSVARSIERKYPEYFAFAMSHKEGRYNSHTNDYRPHSMDQGEKNSCMAFLPSGKYQNFTYVVWPWSRGVLVWDHERRAVADGNGCLQGY
jgi:hypothetical protein